MYLGEEFFSPSKGIQQGNVLGTLLFNIYLDILIKANPLLNDLALNQYLFAFADDLLTEANDKNQAVEVLNALETFKDSGLKMNMKKTQIITDRKDMEDITEIKGIPIQESI